MIYRSFRLICALLLGTFLSPLTASAQEDAPEVIELYGLGDQMMTLDAGAFIPLFLVPFVPIDGSSLISTNLFPGVSGALRWQTYLNSRFAVGAEIGGAVAFDPNLLRLFMVPLTIRGTYTIPLFPLELPIFAGIGVSIIQWNDLLNVAFLAKPGASLLWKYNSVWSFGGSIVYWLVYEPIIWGSDDSDASSHRILGNFAEITVRAVYHF